MAILAKMFTALRGGATEAGEAVVDHQALRILDQEMRDAEKELAEAKSQLAEVMEQAVQWFRLQLRTGAAGAAPASCSLELGNHVHG